MKLSTATDLLAIAGLVLIGAGLYWWHGFAAVIFAGAVLVLVARALTAVERKTAAKATDSAAARQED